MCGFITSPASSHITTLHLTCLRVAIFLVRPVVVTSMTFAVWRTLQSTLLCMQNNYWDWIFADLNNSKTLSVSISCISCIQCFISWCLSDIDKWWTFCIAISNSSLIVNTASVSSDLSDTVNNLSLTQTSKGSLSIISNSSSSTLANWAWMQGYSLVKWFLIFAQFSHFCAEWRNLNCFEMDFSAASRLLYVFASRYPSKRVLVSPWDTIEIFLPSSIADWLHPPIQIIFSMSTATRCSRNWFNVWFM